MSAIKNRKVAPIQTDYTEKKAKGIIQLERKRKLLFRRLSVFFVIVAIASFSMVTTLLSQASALEKKSEEQKQMNEKLKQLKEEETALSTEIKKLNDDEYIAKLLRKNYYLSKNGEIIFTLPEKSNDEKEKAH
ncbi:septum formation initiator family protein [Bacillaceae bacterium Marseille-Q3522]|nr:septum formation initiator family protein [Bacillaceae bacterium Marseille-Q3522]